MDAQILLAKRFEAQRSHLRGVAYRMLGSLGEAEDAVQETWLRLGRVEADEIANLNGWLTTVIGRVCLDMLRSRKSRREDSLDEDDGVGRHPEPVAQGPGGGDPQAEAELADAVGLALLVVLEALTPAERVAFVLHDMFDLSFEEIAPIVERSPLATRQLASRARRRVQGRAAAPEPVLTGQRSVIEAFLTAARSGDLPGLLAVLAPDVVFRADVAAARLGSQPEILGAAAVAKAYVGRAQQARAALVDGQVGVLVAPRGHLLLVLNVRVEAGRIVAIDAVADPSRLQRLELAALPG